MQIDVPVSDVADRISILRLKVARLPEPEPSRTFLTELESAWRNGMSVALEDLPEFLTLSRVNAELWQVEDDLRSCERQSVFDSEFVRLARSVYRLNDARSAAKRSLDERFDSRLHEQKAYASTSGT